MIAARAGRRPSAFRDIPYANNDSVLSNSFEVFGVFRLAVRIKFDMKEPLIPWNALHYLEEIVRDRFCIGEGLSLSFQIVPL